MSPDDPFLQAINALREAESLPLSQLDECDRRAKEALRELARVAMVDISPLIIGHARLVKAGRDFVDFMNRSVAVTTAMLAFTTASAMLLVLVRSGATAFTPTAVFVTFFAVYVRFERWRTLRQSLCNRPPLQVEEP